MRDGQAMISALRHRLIRVPARPVHHAGALILHLPAGTPARRKSSPAPAPCPQRPDPGPRGPEPTRNHATRGDTPVRQRAPSRNSATQDHLLHEDDHLTAIREFGPRRSRECEEIGARMVTIRFRRPRASPDRGYSIERVAPCCCRCVIGEAIWRGHGQARGGVWLSCWRSRSRAWLRRRHPRGLRIRPTGTTSPIPNATNSHPQAVPSASWASTTGCRSPPTRACRTSIGGQQAGRPEQRFT